MGGAEVVAQRSPNARFGGLPALCALGDLARRKDTLAQSRRGEDLLRCVFVLACSFPFRISLFVDSRAFCGHPSFFG